MKRLWRIAGILCIAHVVLLLAGYSQQRSPVFGSSPQSIVSLYASVPAGQMYAGGFLVALAWLVLLTAMTLVARLLRGASDTAGWFSSLVLTAATAATVVTLAGSYAAAGAAYYGATHGYSTDVVAGLNMISKFSDFIAIIASGLCAIAVGAAGLASAALPRWAAWASVVVGVVGIAGGSGPGQLDTATLVWFAWLVMTGVVLIRGGSRRVLGGACTDTVLSASVPGDRFATELS